MHTDPKTGIAPHDCIDCGEPCYIPFGLSPLCTNRECQHFDEDTWVEHVLLLPDDEIGVAFEIDEDAKTDPGWGLNAWLPAPSPFVSKCSPKVTGGGKLNLPTWDDLVQEYLDGDTSSTVKLYHHATTIDHFTQIAEARRDWYRINAHAVAARTGKMRCLSYDNIIVDDLDND